MSNTYPYYTEPTHDQGAAITLAAANAGRTTATSLAEERLIVDAVDKIFLLERTKLFGSIMSKGMNGKKVIKIILL